MSEEQAVDTTEEMESVEYSEVEQEAIEKGWNPEGVEGKRNLSAEEFLDRQSLYDEIRSLKKAVKNRDKDIELIATQFKDMSAKAREKAIKELRQEKKNALQDEDHDRVIEIDEELDAIREQEREEESKVTASSNTAFDEWIQDNSWYVNDVILRGAANAIGEQLYAENPSADVSEIYDQVAKTIKKEFPEKFGSKRRQPSPVEGSTPSSNARKSKSKYSERDLDEDARRMMNTMIKSGAITKEEYIKQLVETGYFE